MKRGYPDDFDRDEHAVLRLRISTQMFVSLIDSAAKYSVPREVIIRRALHHYFHNEGLPS